MMDAFKCKNCGRFFTVRKEIAISKCPLCGSKDFSAVIPMAGDRIIDWEQARVDAAIGAMTAMLASPALMEVVTNPTNVVEKSFEGRVAKLSAQYADALISELKKEKKDNE